MNDVAAMGALHGFGVQIVVCASRTYLQNYHAQVKLNACCYFIQSGFLECKVTDHDVTGRQTRQGLCIDQPVRGNSHERITLASGVRGVHSMIGCHANHSIHATNNELATCFDKRCRSYGSSSWIWRSDSCAS